MDWRSEDRGNAIVAAPVGAVDHDSAEDFEKNLTAAMRQAAAAGTPLVFDLGGVEYMSSVGLRALMRVAKEAKTGSVRVAVANLNETMLEIFQISRFDKIFPVHTSVDAVVAG
jgi:anti-sigma B factor antagonist